MRVARSCCLLSLAAPLMLGSPAHAELPDTFWYDGFAPAPDGQGLDAPVTALGEYDGDLIAGGLFSSGGGTPLNHIGVWDGTAWTALGSGVNDAPRAFTTFWAELGGGTSARVRAAVVAHSSLYIGGEFATVGATDALRVARWDGTDWHALGDGLDGDVADPVSWTPV